MAIYISIRTIHWVMEDKATRCKRILALMDYALDCDMPCSSRIKPDIFFIPLNDT